MWDEPCCEADIGLHLLLFRRCRRAWQDERLSRLLIIYGIGIVRISSTMPVMVCFLDARHDLRTEGVERLKQEPEGRSPPQRDEAGLPELPLVCRS